MKKLLSSLFLITLLFLGCGDSNSNNFESSTSSGFQDENIIPTESYECDNNYQCSLEEICFQHECSHFRGLVYEVQLLEYQDLNKPFCKNYQYEALSDNKLIYISSISNCGSEWPKDSFSIHGDEILEIRIWILNKFDFKESGEQICNWNEEYKVCTQLPFKFFGSKYTTLKYKNKLVKFSVKPIGNLNVEL